MPQNNRLLIDSDKLETQETTVTKTDQRVYTYIHRAHRWQILNMMT